MREYAKSVVTPILAKLTPVQAALLLGGLTYAVTMAIRILIEGKLYWLRWWAFKIGDPIGFPIFGFFAAQVLRGYVPSNRWYDRGWVRIVLCIIWWGVGINNTIGSMNNRGTTLEDALAPSELYHSAMMGPVGAIICSSLIPLAKSKAPRRTKLVAIAGLSIWVLALVYDTLFNQDAPGR